MNKGFLNQTLRIPVRLENATGVDINSAAAANVDVYIAFEDEDVFSTVLTPTTQYTLEFLAQGQYWLRINASLITKTGNIQILVENDGFCPAMVTKYYSAHISLPEHLIHLAIPGSFVERNNITSGRITRSGYATLGVMFTSGGDNTSFDINTLEGAIISNKNPLSSQRKNFIILGGYFFNDTGDTTEKVFGIALSKDKFGDSSDWIKEGGTAIIDNLWTGTDLSEAGHGNGWTFIVIDVGADAVYPTSGAALDLYMNPSFYRVDRSNDIFPEGATYADMLNGVDTDKLPYGTQGSPMSKVEKALTLAIAHNLNIVKIRQGSANESLGAGGDRLKYRVLEGLTSPFNSVGSIGYITFTGSPPQLNNTMLINLRVLFNGEMKGTRLFRCSVVTNSSGDDGNAMSTTFEANMAFSRNWIVEDCTFNGGDINLTGTSVFCHMRRSVGEMTLKNINSAGHNIIIDDFEGKIIIDLDTCTLGALKIRGGKGEIAYIGTGGGTTITIDGFLDRWNEMIEYSGTTPRYTAAALVNAPTSAATWTATELANIRHALGVDGTKTAPTAGYGRLGNPNFTDIVGDIANLIIRAKGLDEIHDDLAVAKGVIDSIKTDTGTTLPAAIAAVPDAAAIQAACTAALTAYPVATRAEATSDKNEILAETTFLRKVQKNKRDIKLESGQYYLYIYDDDSSTPIVKCLLEKFGGGAIGALAGTTEPVIRNKTSV
jgi:hypothetical protein